MGHTHFDKVCGVNGVYTGAKGSEVPVPASAAIAVNLIEATTAAEVQYCVAPIAGEVLGYAVYSVSAGTGRTVAVSNGSAGDNLAVTPALAASGTVGTISTMAASAGGNTVTAGQCLKVTLASCATAQVQVGCTLIFTPTA